MTKEQFAKYIDNFEFSELFRTQGWDNFTAAHKIDAQKFIYNLTGVAQKKNFPILQCVSDHNKTPDLNTRKQLDKRVRNLYFEHLLIIINKEKTWQYWQLPLYEDKKLKNLISFTWNKGQDVESIFQKLRNIVFTLDEEDIITLADVKERVNTLSSNSEKVTKKFYAEFIKQHQAFLGFIKGIEDVLPDNENEKKQWYASLMLNRLMFCYFIQKKGFLDWNTNYLPEKLSECKKLTGKNNFFGFYRSFLLELFHNELGRPEDKRQKRVSPVSFGTIPYLNGGLFDVHELENGYKNISIKDEAFKRIFDFFDDWNWHLDTRITATGKDINPDVIGYIFEKYINQKEMGAYYTKEDITDYIGKNTIIPFLLDKVKSYYPAPFEPGYGFYQFLQDSGDEYIYDSVKKGAEGLSSIDNVDISGNIRIGIDTSKPNLLDRRKDWNTATPEEIGLPTEIWRDTIARLQRYFELKAKIKKGDLQDINDLITYNLNIRKLVQDYLEQTRDKEFIRKFYKALCEITILDPTCGSGAFLFAALNILEPLYEVCIQRMEELFDINPKGNKDFEDKLVPIKSGDHPNMSYYIFKTIILNNLYGVDLMNEAVEIAKLRLFLKLVAEVDPSRRKKNYGLEPLPDIDFNIRSGNTLVGFATGQQLEEVVKKSEGDLIYKEKLEELKSAFKSVAASYDHFQKIQVSTSSNSEKYKEIKISLSKELKILDEKLNRYLADTYGLGAQTQWKSKKEKENAYQDWKDRHRPFHWLAEFYEIINKGGFDVVIGNPPYVELKDVKDYSFSGYHTIKCGNLYANCYERAISLGNEKSLVGFIIPVASVCADGYSELQNIWQENGTLYISCYNDRPAKLFEGIEHSRLVIVLLNRNYHNKAIYSTKYNKWNSIYREHLFGGLILADVTQLKNESLVPKINYNLDTTILKKINANKNNLAIFIKKTSTHTIFYTRKLSGFVQILNFIPKIVDIKEKNRNPSELKEICFENEEQSLICLAILNSSLFYWYLTVWSDCRNLNKREIENFPIDLKALSSEISKKLNILSLTLMKDIITKSSLNQIGALKIQCTYPKKSKPIIDEIDKILAKHYGFTDEELDFIINYDIKYRMGSELEGE